MDYGYTASNRFSIFFMYVFVQIGIDISLSLLLFVTCETSTHEAAALMQTERVPQTADSTDRATSHPLILMYARQ